MSESVCSGHPCEPGSDVLSASFAAIQCDGVCSDYARGRGIFAQRRFVSGEVIERAPVLAVPSDQWGNLERTLLVGYCCTWGDGGALALGFAPFYSHSHSPNAVFTKRIEALIIEVVAVCNIEAGEEIVIVLDRGPDAKRPMWIARGATLLPARRSAICRKRDQLPLGERPSL